MKTILLIIAAISLVLIPAEAETITLQILWSGTWMIVLYASTKIFEKLYLKEKEDKK